MENGGKQGPPIRPGTHWRGRAHEPATFAGAGPFSREGLGQLTGQRENHGRGGQVDEQIMHYAGADGYGLNAMDAVSMSRKWVGGQPNGKDA
ncbi:MAG: hypothetical protein V1689_06050 [Pseudomonadota bacterium]